MTYFKRRILATCYNFSALNTWNSTELIQHDRSSIESTETDITVKTPPSDTRSSHKDYSPTPATGEIHPNEITFRYLIQPIGHFQYISPNITYLTGHSQTEYYKHPNLWTQCLHPDDQSDQIQLLLGKEKGNNTRVRIQKPGYGYIWVEQKVKIRNDDEGQPLAIDVACLIQDEEHLKRVSGDLCDPNLAHLLDLSPIAFCISNIETQRIRFVDQQFTRFLEYPINELLGIEDY